MSATDEETEAEREARFERADKAGLPCWPLGCERSRDPNAAALLYNEMSELSEHHWCAGWLIGLEFDLWMRLQSGKLGEYGMFELEEQDIARLRALSEQSGGWCEYERWMPMDEWEERAKKGTRR